MLSAYFLHRVLAVLFLLITTLPFVALIKRHKQAELRSTVIWQNLIRLTNIGLLIVLITGIMIYPIFNSVRFWIAIALTLIIGGLLGMISQQLKQYKMQTEHHSRLNHLERISLFGFTYFAVIGSTLGFMAYWYQF